MSAQLSCRVTPTSVVTLFLLLQLSFSVPWRSHHLVGPLGRNSTKVARHYSLEPRLSVLDFVSQLWRKIGDKIQSRKPEFEASKVLEQCVTLLNYDIGLHSHDVCGRGAWWERNLGNCMYYVATSVWAGRSRDKGLPAACHL